MCLLENLKDMENSKSQIFNLWIMKQNKHGQELDNTLKILKGSKDNTKHRLMSL